MKGKPLLERIDDAEPGRAPRPLSPRVSMRLDLTDGSELLTVLDNGPFAFATELGDGASFVVSMVGAAPCVLGGERGMVTGSDVQVMLVCEGVLGLQDPSISGPTAPDQGFAPETLAYGAEVSLMQQATQVTATTIHPAARITIAGMAAESGVAGPELPLGLGENVIDVVVSHPVAGQRRYRITVSRAAQLAQYVYGKASNTGVNDRFGHSVALSGDTLAVGALLESSAATGPHSGQGGTQADNTASASGAVYILH